MDVNGAKDILARKMNLAERARQDATNATPMGDIISEIVAGAADKGKEEADRVRRHRDDAEENITALKSGIADAEKTLAAPVAGLAMLESNVKSAERVKHIAEANYNRFREDNGLTRFAADDDRFVQICWAFVIVVVEGALNSYFFAPAFEGGLAGGFFVAFFISLINVAFAFTGGAAGLRYLNHIQSHAKLRGMVAFFGCAAVCAGTVALSAYFRGNVDILLRDGADINRITQLAWERSLDNLRQLELFGLLKSLSSFLLVFVGALCAFFGFWKGYEFDDPYPEFGGMQRQLNNAQNALQDAQDKYAQALGNQNRGLAGIKNALESAYRKAHAGVAGLESACKECGRLSADAQQLATGLLNFYCREYRKISDPPDEVRPIPDDRFAFLAENYGEIAREIGEKFGAAKSDFLRAQSGINNALGGQGQDNDTGGK